MLQFLSRWANKHVAHEQRMISASTNNPNIDAIFGVPASKAIYDIDTIPSIQIIDGALPVDFPNLYRE